MARHRSHGVAFKKQVAEEYLAGESLHGLAKRHDVSRNLIRIWVAKYEAGEFDEDVEAADRLQEYEAGIAALERLVCMLTWGGLPTTTETTRRMAPAPNDCQNA